MITTSLLLLSVPVLTFAALQDRKGNKHPNLDLLWCALVEAVFALIVCLWVDPSKNFIQCFGMGVGIGWVVWPWLINYLMIFVFKKKNGEPIVELKKGEKWYNHMSPDALPDRIYVWKNSPWYVRFFGFQLIPFCLPLIYWMDGNCVFSSSWEVYINCIQ